MTIEPTTGSSEARAEYLQRLETQLSGSGFRSVRGDSQPFALTALRSGIELTKFGNVDNFIAVSIRPTITVAELDQLSATAFGAAKAAPKGFRMPRGFGQGLFCNLLVIVDSSPADVTESVERKAPPKHWSAQESRSVYDLSTNTLHLFEGTPIWGAAYAASQRKLLRSLFS